MRYEYVDLIFIVSSCIPWIDISSDVSCATNIYNMPKLQPWEIDVPIYPDGVHIMAFHLLGLGFWMFRVLHYFLIISRPSSLILTQFIGLQPPHLFSEIRYQCPSYFIYIFSVSIFQLCDINEIKSYFCCIFLFMSINVFYCVPA